MKPEAFVDCMQKWGAVAVLRANTEDSAGPAMQAAIRGGFRLVEFTLSTPGAMELIESFSRLPDVVVGAGSVLTAEQARDAARCGAKFLVSPVVDEAVIEAAHSLNVAVMPGTHTPTEMLRAHRAGAQLQKVFPMPSGGPAFVAACLGPMPFLRLVPTHGVDASNVAAFQGAGAFAVGFVGPLFGAQDVAEGRVDRIEEKARSLLAAMRRN